MERVEQLEVVVVEYKQVMPVDAENAQLFLPSFLCLHGLSLCFLKSLSSQSLTSLCTPSLASS